MADAFGPIKPAPVSDFFVFDFTAQIGSAGGTIATALWSVAVDFSSPESDPNPTSRILAAPTFSSNKTSALLGNMIDGVIYDITSQVTLSDSRVLTDAATLLCTSVVTGDAPLTVGQFRINFPAFKDTVRFTDEEVQYWIDQAYSPPNSTAAINQYRWGQFYQLGLQLWVAHNLAVQDMMYQRAGMPGMGGGSTGFISMPLTGSGVASSKSVDGVSLSYDNQIGMEKDAGWWGSTPWGNQFLYYLRMAGSAPIQL
jgi:hypothetical protein